MLFESVLKIFKSGLDKGPIIVHSYAIMQSYFIPLNEIFWNIKLINLYPPRPFMDFANDSNALLAS